MRLLPRGIRWRATVVAVLATALVIAIFGLVSTLVVQRSASNAVRELVSSRLDEVLAQLATSDEVDSASSAIEAVGPGNRVFVQVVAANGDFLVQSSGMPGERTPCSPGADFIGASASVVVRGGPLQVCTAASAESVEIAVRNVAAVMSILGPIVLVGVGLAVWLALGRALRSVDGLRAQAERMSGVDDGQLVIQPTGDEVERLGTTLNALLDRARAQARARRQFVADAGHELRNPLATLRVLLELRERSAEAEADALLELARLEHLVQDLLTLAKSDAQGTQPWPESRVVDVSSVVIDAVRSVSRGDSRVLPGGVDEHCFVIGDERSLRGAVDNLLSNGLRHCASQVRVRLRQQGQSIILRVDDDGAGLDVTDVERVFERFVRLDAARVRDGGGSGLGLAIVSATAQAHGGAVMAEGGPGGAFVMTLPAAEVRAGAPQVALSREGDNAVTSVSRRPSGSEGAVHRRPRPGRRT